MLRRFGKRQGEMAARYGGEEFTLVIEKIGCSGASRSLPASIEDLGIPASGFAAWPRHGEHWLCHGPSGDHHAAGHRARRRGALSLKDSGRNRTSGELHFRAMHDLTDARPDGKPVSSLLYGRRISAVRGIDSGARRIRLAWFLEHDIGNASILPEVLAFARMTA